MTTLDAIGAGKYFFASRGKQIIGGYQKTIITFLNISLEFSLSAKCNACFIKKISRTKSDIWSWPVNVRISVSKKPQV